MLLLEQPFVLCCGVVCVLHAHTQNMRAKFFFGRRFAPITSSAFLFSFSHILRVARVCVSCTHPEGPSSTTHSREHGSMATASPKTVGGASNLAVLRLPPATASPVVSGSNSVQSASRPMSQSTSMPSLSKSHLRAETPQGRLEQHRDHALGRKAAFGANGVHRAGDDATVGNGVALPMRPKTTAAGGVAGTKPPGIVPPGGHYGGGAPAERALELLADRTWLEMEASTSPTRLGLAMSPNLSPTKRLPALQHPPPRVRTSDSPVGVGGGGDGVAGEPGMGRSAAAAGGALGPPAGKADDRLSHSPYAAAGTKDGGTSPPARDSPYDEHQRLKKELRRVKALCEQRLAQAQVEMAAALERQHVELTGSLEERAALYRQEAKEAQIEQMRV